MRTRKSIFKLALSCIRTENLTGKKSKLRVRTEAIALPPDTVTLASSRGGLYAPVFVNDDHYAGCAQWFCGWPAARGRQFGNHSLQRQEFRRLDGSAIHT